jgi:hypothetical protein
MVRATIHLGFAAKTMMRRRTFLDPSTRFLGVWQRQSPAFFDVLRASRGRDARRNDRRVQGEHGTLVGTTGECKEGMNLSYNGRDPMALGNAILRPSYRLIKA